MQIECIAKLYLCSNNCNKKHLNDKMNKNEIYDIHTLKELLKEGISFKELENFISKSKDVYCKIFKHKKYGFTMGIDVENEVKGPEQLFLGFLSKSAIYIYNSKAFNQEINDMSEDEFQEFLTKNKEQIFLKSYITDTEKEIHRFFYKKRKIKQKDKPRVAVFKQIKISTAPSGSAYAFCKYKGRYFYIQKEVIEGLGLKFNSKTYSIDLQKTLYLQTNKEDVYRLLLKVPNGMWIKIKDLKEALSEGINWNTLSEKIINAGLIIEKVEGQYGQFISIHPPDYYKTDRQRHHVNIYAGKSLKSKWTNEISLLDFIQKNEDVMVFKAFEKKDQNQNYYRCYIKKGKNSIKQHIVKT